MDAGVSAGIAVAVAAVVLCGLVVALVFKWHPTCAAACPPPPHAGPGRSLGSGRPGKDQAGRPSNKCPQLAPALALDTYLLTQFGPALFIGMH